MISSPRTASSAKMVVMVHDVYFVEVKTPAKSSGPWDYYKI